jgi:hypothetical protein
MTIDPEIKKYALGNEAMDNHNLGIRVSWLKT